MSTAQICVVIAALLPLIFTGIAKFSGRGFDNARVRDFQERLEGFRKRAHWAHLNSIEAFAPFAAAVIIATQMDADPQWRDGLAVAFIALRVAYGYCYIKDWPTARSVMWLGALVCTLWLFFLGAF